LAAAARAAVAAPAVPSPTVTPPAPKKGGRPPNTWVQTNSKKVAVASELADIELEAAEKGLGHCRCLPWVCWLLNRCFSFYLSNFVFLKIDCCDEHNIFWRSRSFLVRS
jgi:hypothetical protein